MWLLGSERFELKGRSHPAYKNKQAKENNIHFHNICNVEVLMLAAVYRLLRYHTFNDNNDTGFPHKFLNEVH